MTAQPGRRRRADELRDAIRAAVLAELDERGYQGLTFEGVARRAGTSKPVLYRRYSSRAEMTIDAFLPSRMGRPPATSTGPLRSDLIALLDGLLARVGPDGVRIFRGVIGEVEDATVARVAAQVLAQFAEWLTDITDRARAAGELGPGTIPPRVNEAIVALVRNEILFVHGASQEPDVEGLVDDVILPLLRTTTRAPEIS